MVCMFMKQSQFNPDTSMSPPYANKTSEKIGYFHSYSQCQCLQLGHSLIVVDKDLYYLLWWNAEWVLETCDFYMFHSYNDI